MKPKKADPSATILLAGFDSFPDAPSNPTARLVRADEAVALDGTVRLARLVLPVEWERSWQVLEAEIARVRPDAVLLFGLDAAAECFRIEMTAVNARATDKPDAAGRRATSIAICDAPERLSACLPLDSVRHVLAEAGVEYASSHDAGRYLCNETLFHLCRNGPALGLRYYGFVHSPLTDECAAEWPASQVRDARTVPAASLSLVAAHLIGCLAAAVARAPAS